MKRTYLNFILILKIIAICFSIGLVLFIISPKSFAVAGINRQINFQGKLVNNPVATNVSDTSYTVVFALYDKASGGTNLWTETQTVTTTDGIFRVALGSVTPIPTNFNFNWDGLYLGIKVNADTEMTPRVQMTSVPFAFNSQKVAGLTVLDSTSAAASTSATLKLGDATTPKTFDLGAQNLTFTTSGDTTLTLPTSGTLLTNTATAVQTVTSTQTTGTVLGVADSSALSGAITGFNIALTSSTNSQNKTGITFDLSGGSSGTYYDILGTGSTWSITRAGILNVASCTGCGGGSNYWNLVSGNGVGNGGYITPINSTADFFLGAQSTTSAKFSVLNLNSGTPVASIAGNLVIGQGGQIRSQYDDLQLAYKSGADTWTTGLSIADVTGNITTVGSLNGLTLAAQATGFTIAGGTTSKTFTLSNTLTLSGTDGSSLNIGAGGALGSNAYTSTAYAPLASPTFTGTVTIPTPFTLGATSVTSTGTQLNYLNAATGTTGTTNTNLVFSASPTFTGTLTGATATFSGTLTIGNGTTNQLRSAYGPLQLAYKSAANTWTNGLMLEDTTGFIGVGTSDPTALLHLEDTNNDKSYQLVMGWTGNEYRLGRNSVNGYFDFTGTQYGFNGYRFYYDTTKLAQTIEAGSGNIGLGIADPISELHVTRPLSYDANGKALTIFDQIENQDIFTASKSGTPKFIIGQNGEIGLGLTGGTTGVQNFGTSGDCLKSGGTGAIATWAGCGGGGGVASAFVIDSSTGVTRQVNNTTDFLLGAVSTTSAKFSITGLAGSEAVLSLLGSATIGNNTGDDISKNTTSDFTQSGYSVTTADGVDTVTTTSNQLKLQTDLTGGTLTSPASGASTGVNMGIAMPSLNSATTSAMQRPDGTFLVITGGSANTTRIYDPVQNIYTAGPPLQGGVAGNGVLMFQRNDGSAVIIHGGSLITTTSIYYPWNALGGGGQMKAGPALPPGASIGPGSQVMRLSDGRFLIIVGGGNNRSLIYDPTVGTTDLGSFYVGPLLTSTVGPGSFAFHVNGLWVIGLGCQNVACSSSSTTNIYNASTNSFSAGPNLTAGSSLGAHVIQRPDNKWLVILGRSTTTTNTYDPATNAFTNTGAVTTAAVNQGGHSFQRPDGKWITVLGGNSAVVNLYDPSADTFSNPSTNLSAAAGPGALTFQRPDGKYIVVHGNGAQTTTVFDGGWNTTGTWTSEDITSTKISTYSAIFWDANLQSLNNTARLDKIAMTLSVKTGQTQAELAVNQYKDFIDSGSLIQAVGQAAWAKIRVVFDAPVRSYTQKINGYIDQTNIWSGEGYAFKRRSFLQPALYSLRIQNPLVAYGGLARDPQFGRNFATSGATLEGVITDNNNQLTVEPNRNLPVATPSAGFIIASSSANLGGSAAAGAHTIELSNGDFLVLLGGNATATRLYEPNTNNFSTGPTLPNGCGTGCHSMQMQDGRFFVVLGNNTKNTAIYDPAANVFTAGPNLANAATTGATTFMRPDGLFIIIAGTTTATNIFDPFSLSMSQGPALTALAAAGTQIIRRPDGRITIMLGGVATGNTYDAATNAFIAGPNITTGTLTTGSLVMQLSTGRFLVKTSTTLSQTLDPITNTYTVGPATAVNVAAGSFAIPRPDGNILWAPGGVTTTQVYDPAIGATNVTGLFAATASSPTLPCTPGAGAHVFQRADGPYVLICGGSNATTTAIIDAGWNLGGTYTTEHIHEPLLSSSTALYWKNAGIGSINAKYRTAATRVALGLATWKDAEYSGWLINPSAGDIWFQSRFDLEGTMPDMPGAKSKVWLAPDAGSVSVYYRTVRAPILSYWKLLSTPLPTLLTLTSGGSNAFRFSADGQAFTNDGGAWNSGGADLAERYTSTQTLDAGEVVVGDRLRSQNVERSTIPYQTNIMGVVSTQPGFVAGAYTPDSHPIALVGRVPVKVSTENGQIKSGDYLTSASIPGYAMKATVAGRVLGTALEDFDPSDSNNNVDCPKDGAGSLSTTQCGTVTAFINLTSYNGQNIETLMADKGFIDSSGLDNETSVQSEGISMLDGISKDDNKILKFLKMLKDKNGIEANSQVVTGKLSALKVISPEIIADLIIAKTIRADHIEGLEILTNQISALNSQVSVLSTATQSAELASVSANINLSGLNLNSTATASADFNIKGNSLVEGMLMVLKSVTTPNLLVSDFASFFGDVFFKKNVSFEGRPTFNSDTAGFAVINKGEKSIEVTFDDEYISTPVVAVSIALNKGTDDALDKKLEDAILSGNISYVITQRTTKGFVIRLNQTATSDIDFSWIAISVKNAKTQKLDLKQTSVSFDPVSTQSAAFQSILNQLNNQ